MTQHASEGLGAVWSDVEPRLRRFLRSRQLPEWVVDDVVQETAVRILVRWDAVETNRDLFPLAATIAINLARDGWRDAKSQVSMDEVVLAEGDPQEVALERIEWCRAMRALKALIPRYRNLLLAEAGLVADQPRSSAANNARMRARRRLRHILEHELPVAVPSVGLRNRWIDLRAWFVRKRPAPMPVLGPDGIAALALCTIAALGGALDVVDPSALQTTVTKHSRLDGINPGANTGTRGGAVASSRPEGGVVESRPGTRTNVRNRPVPRQAEPALEVPRVKSHGDGMQSFGKDGYDLSDEGEISVAGERVRWRQSHSARTPRCVEQTASGTISRDCSGGEAPRGGAEVEAQGRKTRARYGP